MPLSQSTYDALLREFWLGDPNATPPVPPDPGAGVDAISLVILGLNNLEPGQGLAQVAAPLSETVRVCMANFYATPIQIDAQGTMSTVGAVLQEMKAAWAKFYYFRTGQTYASTVEPTCP